GLLWGYTAMDLGNNVRAALVLRELAAAPTAAADWQALPATLRFGQAAANTAGTAVVVLAVGLLAREPSLLGFVAGAGAYLVRQRLAVAEAITSTDPEQGPEQPPDQA
ncbi:MAG: hypothetical protein HYU66_00135, partial [Armatimonadetes bacterium]|nr:hypothetical protein [Armatimonadota bacterium]